MGQVYAINGVVEFTSPSDYFVPVGAQQILSVIVMDETVVESTGSLYAGDDNADPIIFLYRTGGVTPGTHWYDLGGCPTTGRNVLFEGSAGITFRVFVR